ncbi:extracellular solute-binding protein [Hydrogenophaga sp. ZJX-1]|uniref:extracellular solute-binding protein n=1 Tax=Hydrogenophaga sp. ZJX-1 TaxID=3404778 RepID=UPI003B28B649
MKTDLKHPHRASSDPLKGAALAVRQSRPGGALGWAAACVTAVIVSVGLLASTAALAQSSIVVASTTSTEQSGLFSYLLPEFKKASGIDVKVVALGTGQAIDMARRGDADVLFVHDKVAEEKFVADGFAAKRQEVMYNDFVLIGPKADPAGTKGTDIVAALKKVATANAPFISRGDKSGTHAAELRFWKMTDTDANKGSGYKECGCGMGPALNIGASSGAYVLADRGTWLNFKNRADMVVLVEGDRRLFNQYGVMLVSAAKHPQVKTAEGQKFVDWVTGDAGQKAIASYKIGGEQLFFPNAAAASR